MKIEVKADFEAYMKDLEKKLAGGALRNALASGFSDAVTSAQKHAQAYTRQTFALHTDWVPKGILAIPATAAQRSAAVRSMETHGDFLAAIYYRHASEPRRSYQFIDDHAVGRTRKPRGSAIAVPSAATKAYGHKTARGAVKKAWQPGVLLSDMDASGARYDGVTTRSGRRKRTKGGSPPKPFMVFSRKLQATVVARRRGPKAYPLEVLYIFRDKINIPEKYGFVAEVWRALDTNLLPDLRKRVQQAVG